ncbi:MAG: MMPL family transporter, partial [Verrucomicrobiota bacterium]
ESPELSPVLQGRARVFKYLGRIDEAERDLRQAIRRTFVTVGSPLVMTTVVIIAGFAAVLISQLPTHRSFAILGSMTLAGALVADLIILPALLACLSKKTGDSHEDKIRP